jgi:hypothetical protein
MTAGWPGGYGATSARGRSWSACQGVACRWRRRWRGHWAHRWTCWWSDFSQTTDEEVTRWADVEGRPVGPTISGPVTLSISGLLVEH